MTGEQSKLIAKLYAEAYEDLLSYARWSLGNFALAEEAVQETFFVACQKADRLQMSPNPRGWIIKVLKNVVLNTKRTRANAARIMTYYLVQQGDACAENQHSLETTYGDLSQTEDFRLLKEYILDGRSHYQLAQARGITVSTCKKRLQRAKESLKRKILE